jgi:hypothetical protein
MPDNWHAVRASSVSLPSAVKITLAKALTFLSAAEWVNKKETLTVYHLLQLNYI